LIGPSQFSFKHSQSTPPKIEEQRCFPFGPLYSFYIWKKYDFGQSIYGWKCGAIGKRLGNLKRTPWKLDENTLGTRKQTKEGRSPPHLALHQTQKKIKNWAFLHICQDFFSLVAWNFSLKKITLHKVERPREQGNVNGWKINMDDYVSCPHIWSGPSSNKPNKTMSSKTHDWSDFDGPNSDFLYYYLNFFF
jgi:hypothetical protein